jgi:8-hydroxy-5-deazaflavin:NADPH oxidoreductase
LFRQSGCDGHHKNAENRTHEEWSRASAFTFDCLNGVEHERDHHAEIATRDEAGLPESRWVEQRLGRPVIKAFNNIYARHLLELGRPAGAPGRIAWPIADDDDVAEAVVLKLVEELGFDGVDAGGSDESWRQQPGTPVYTKDFDADGVRRGLHEANKDRTPDWSGISNSPGSFAAPA